MKTTFNRVGLFLSLLIIAATATASTISPQNGAIYLEQVTVPQQGKAAISLHSLNKGVVYAISCDLEQSSSTNKPVSMDFDGNGFSYDLTANDYHGDAGIYLGGNKLTEKGQYGYQGNLYGADAGSTPLNYVAIEIDTGNAQLTFYNDSNETQVVVSGCRAKPSVS